MTDGGVFVAHPGAQHSRQAVLALQERGVLRRYFTGSLYFRERGAAGSLVRALPVGLRSRLERQLRRRRFEPLDERYIVSSDAMDLMHQVADRLGLPPSIGFRVYKYRQARFQRRAARMVEELRPSVVVCYDTAALEVFRAAKRVGAICVLDQSIGHVTTLVEQYTAAGLPHGQDEAFVATSLAEVRSADVVVAASRYVATSLVKAGVDAERIIVIPFGVDLERFRPATRREPRARIEALCVGHVSRRKGVPTVFDALAKLSDRAVRLTVLGKVVDDVPFPPVAAERFRHLAAVPHQEVAEYFRDADLFVQMSWHEGSALTVYEALASGLPVITTPNAGSVVRDGIEGFIVPPGDADALAERIRVVAGDAALRATMGRNARLRAEQFGWEQYRSRFGSLIADLSRAGEQWPAAFAEHRARMEAVLGMDSQGRTPSRVGAAAGNGHEE